MILFKRKKLALGVTSLFVMSCSISSLAMDKSRIEISFPSQPANLTLVELGKKTGSEIIFKQGVDASVILPSIQGEYSLESALEKLLDGTGLVYQINSDDLILIQNKGQEVNDDVKEPEEVVVVGSRLTNVPSGSNTLSITREEIEQRGFGSMEDVLRSLPQNVNTINAGSTLNGGAGNGFQGQSAANLRGLGTSNTLILVNGRRWAGSLSFSDGTANLNGIPFSAVKQVNVMLDGASAIYGADALGGVIDIILYEQYSGVDLSARYDLGRNGGDQTAFEVTGGYGWSSGNLTASFSVEDIKSVDERKAGATSDDLRSKGGSDWRDTFSTQPGMVRELNFIPIGALPAGDDGTSGLAGLSMANMTPFDNGAHGSQATVDTKRKSAYFRLSQELTNSIQGFAELSYSDSTSDFISGPQGFFGVVPTTNPYNDLGRPVFVGYRFQNEYNNGLFVGPKSETNQTNLTYTLGFEAELPFESWSMDFSASRAEEEARYAFGGQSALDQTLLNQRISGVDGMGNPLPLDQIINVFGDGSANSAEAFDGLFNGTIKRDGLGNTIPDEPDFSRQDQLLVTFSGDLIALPTGDVQTVFGYEYRTENYDRAAPDPTFAAEDLEREINSMFVEVGVPIVSDANAVAGVASLDLKLAARYDDYETAAPLNRSFSNTSPKVDLVWGITDQVRVRLSWGESFKAPNLDELFGAERRFAGLTPIVDPNNPSVGPQLSYTQVLGGRSTLQPELAENTSIGFDWEPSGALEGVRLSVTAGEIDVDDRIDSVSSFLRSDPDVLFSIPGVISYDPVSGLIDEVNLTPVNVAAEVTEFVDFDLSYQFDTSIGGFEASLAGTYTSNKSRKLAANQDAVETNGTKAGPDNMVATTGLTWSRDNWTAGWFVNYSSSYDFINARRQESRVDHYVTHDLTSSYRMDDTGWTFRFGVRNVTNQHYPFIDNTSARWWDDQRVDSRGRIITFDITKSLNL